VFVLQRFSVEGVRTMRRASVPFPPRRRQGPLTWTVPCVSTTSPRQVVVSVRPSVRSSSLVLLDDPIGASNTEYICICTYWRYGKSPIVSAVSWCTWMTCTYTSTMMMCPCREWGECAALGGEEMMGRKSTHINTLNT